MSKETTERRVLSTGCELRVHERDGSPMIVGYAAVFESTSEKIGGRFREVIKRGAFKNSLANGSDVVATINHNSDHVLGRQSNGTLRIKEDRHGLKVEIDPPDTQAAKDLMVSIERGDVSKMSFEFLMIKDTWRSKDGESIRELREVDVHAVSPVTFPAYPDTDVALRSLDAWKNECREKENCVNEDGEVVPFSVFRAKQDLAEAE